MFRQQVDAIFKADASTKVIPSVKAIAEKVLKQQEVEKVHREGTCIIRESRKLHTNQADKIRDAGLAYVVADDEEGSIIYCPVCTDFGGSWYSKQWSSPRSEALRH